MSYEKISRNAYLGKNLGFIADDRKKQNERDLKQLNDRATRDRHRDEELYQFGIELFDNGYSLDDFKMDIELCRESREQFNNGEYPAKGVFNYEGCVHAPSFKKILKIVDDLGYFSSIQNGYEVARRRAYAKSLSNKSK